MKKFFSLLAMVLGFTLTTAVSQTLNFGDISTKSSDNKAVDATRLVIEVPSAGTLSTILPVEQASTVINLKITGYLNNTDIDHLRSFAPLLAILDMSEVIYSSNSFQSDGFKGKTSFVRVQLPKHITNINNSAFNGCSALQRIILPDSLQFIGSYAFQSCTSLDSVVLPKKVYRLNYASFDNCNKMQTISFPKGLYYLESTIFSNCSSLTSVVLSDTLTTIPSSMFENCTSLKLVHLPARLTNISNYAFKNCSSLDSIAFPITLTSIGYQTFESCTSLKSVFLPNNLISLDQYAFRYCYALETVVLPANLNTINYGSFYNCVSLKKLTLPDNLLRIEGNAFNGCSSLQKLNLPKLLQNISNYAFQNCSAMDTLIVPSSVNFIDYGAFRNCSSLKMAKLSNNMTVIKSELFRYCYSLDSIVFPVGLTTIENYAFESCKSLKGQLVLPQFLTSIGYQSFDNCGYSSCKSLSTTPPSLNNATNSLGNIRFAYVPETSFSPYKNAWTGLLIIGGNALTSVDVTLISSGTLGEAILQKVSYLNDVHQLTVSGPMNASDMSVIKQSMPSLISLNLKNARITQIPDNQFNEKSLILEIVLPDSLESIGYRAFFRCTNLRTLRIPDKIKTIGEYLFYECSYLETIVLPPLFESIGNSAFMYCYKLKSIVIPPKVASIGSQTFYYCQSLSEVILSESLTYIGAYAFYDCGLNSLRIPDNVITIDDGAFQYNEFKTVMLNAKLKNLHSHSFANCPIDSIILPSSLTFIEDRAFYQCTSLKNIRCEQSTPPVLSSDPFVEVDKTKVSLTVPFWSAAMYRMAGYWSDFYPVYTINDEFKDIPINGNLILTDNVRFTGTPNVAVSNTGGLTVRGNAPLATDHFALDAALTFNKDDWNYSYYGHVTLSPNFGMLISECPAITANHAYMNLYAYGDVWYYMTFPFDVPVASLTINNGSQFVFRKYDGAARASNGVGNSWKTMTTDSVLKAGEGYIYQCSDDALLTIVPTEDTKQQLFTSTTRSTNLKEHSAASLSNKSWNFVGNPYPAYFDTRYIDFAAPITVWDYYNNTYIALSLTDDQYVLKPYEAFFVQKPEDLTQISFQPQGRQLNSDVRTDGPSGIQRRSVSERKLINLIISSEGYSDKCRVVINPSASLSYELASDASKFTNNQSYVPQLYSMDEEGVRYAINERPLGSGVIRLGCYIGKAATYTLGATFQAEDGERIILYDKLLQKQTLLNEQSYPFSAVEGTFDNRFELNILRNPSQIEATHNDRTSVWCKNGTLHVVTKAGNAVSVYTLNGVLLKELIAPDEQIQISLNKGVYLVKVAGNAYKSVVF